MPMTADGIETVEAPALKSGGFQFSPSPFSLPCQPASAVNPTRGFPAAR